MNEKLRKTINIGLIAGGITLSLCMIGIIDAFNQRFIVTDYFTLAQLLLYGTAFIAGYLAASKQATGWLSKALFGALAAVLSGVPTFLLILLTLVWESIRDSFINVKPDLIEFLTFSRESVIAGGLLLLLWFGVAGIVGAGFAQLPNRFRQPIIKGLTWAIGIGIMSDILVGVLRPRLSTDAIRNLFGSTGLQLVPFVVVLVLVTAVSFWWQQGGQTQYQSVRRNLTPSQQKNTRVGYLEYTEIVLTYSWIMKPLVNTSGKRSFWDTVKNNINFCAVKKKRLR